jgi:formate-dependent nitrite reductase membrane component NrfD
MNDFLANQFPLAVGFKKQTEWAEAPMVLEMSFGAVGGAAFIVSALSGFMWGAVVSFAALMAGKGIFVMADLGKPMRMLNVFKRPFKSWISFGGLCFLLCGITGLAYCCLLYFAAGGAALLWTVKTLAIFFAGVMIVYDGFWLSSATGISAWNSSVLPVLFGLNALAAGIGLAQILGLCFDFPLSVSPGIHAAILTAELICAFSYAEGLFKGPTGAQKSFELLIKGSLSGAFIVGVLIFGALLPALAIGAALDGVVLPAFVTTLSAALEIFAVILLRYSILKAGVYTPVV